MQQPPLIIADACKFTANLAGSIQLNSQQLAARNNLTKPRLASCLLVDWRLHPQVLHAKATAGASRFPLLGCRPRQHHAPRSICWSQGCQTRLPWHLLCVAPHPQEAPQGGFRLGGPLLVLTLMTAPQASAPFLLAGLRAASCCQIRCPTRRLAGRLLGYPSHCSPRMT